MRRSDGRCRSISIRAFCADRFVRAAAVILLALSVLPACMGRGSEMPANKAFALSASALSGSDRYGFAGEVSIIDPYGDVADKSRYEGEVTGHGNLNLQWAGGQVLRARASEGPASFRPLQLLKVIQNGGAKAAYDGPPAADGTVRLRLTLSKDAARSQIADGLRSEYTRLKDGLKGRKLSPIQKKRADEVLSRADRHLEAALSTLKVDTVCLWTTDRRTWFPRQMTERTELAYTLNGKPYREKRESVTNFHPAGRSGTIVKNAFTNP